MKKTETNQTATINNQPVSLSGASNQLRNLYLLNGDALLPLAPEYLHANPATEKNFRSTKELEELVFKNSKTLFGQNTFTVTLQKKDGNLFESNFTPTGFLLDISEIARPKFFILDIITSKLDFFGHIFPRITKYFKFLRSEEAIEKLCELLSKNKELIKELSVTVKPEEIPYYLKAAIVSRPFIQLVTDDNEMDELQEVMEIYSEAWNIVRPMLFKKYTSSGTTFCLTHSLFTPVKPVYQKERKKREITSYTEENHLEKVSENVKEIYSTMKTELLKTDNQLRFNTQKYYISLKKNKNIAFFKFSISKVTLVLLNPEKETRKQIKHYEVRTLKESVQKFWNGECCEILIDNTTHLNEVIGIIKKLIAD